VSRAFYKNLLYLYVLIYGQYFHRLRQSVHAPWTLCPPPPCQNLVYPRDKMSIPRYQNLIGSKKLEKNLFLDSYYFLPTNRATVCLSISTISNVPWSVLRFKNPFARIIRSNAWPPSLAVLCVSDCSQPRRPTVVWVRFVVDCEHTSDSVFIQAQPECQVDLLSYTWTAVSWIALFHRNDGIYDVSGWSLWIWLPPTTG